MCLPYATAILDLWNSKPPVFDYSDYFKLSVHHFGISKLKGVCTGSSESTLVKMPHCWKSHVMALITFTLPFMLKKQYQLLNFDFGCRHNTVYIVKKWVIIYEVLCNDTSYNSFSKVL